LADPQISPIEAGRLDLFVRGYYELLFKVRFTEAHGQAFQDFFSDIMEKAFPGDFHRVKPWGPIGDLKNDGYVSSKRLIFQVYAPSALSADETTAKMEEDFEGAFDHWAPHCDGWVFVTNERTGLPAPVERKLLELNSRHAGISVASWGYEELRRLVFGLADAEIAALLGPIPARTDVADVRYRDLDTVLEGIANRMVGAEPDLTPVDPGKLNANGLSEWVSRLLAVGFEGATSVGAYFRDHYSPTKGDEVAAQFTAEYVRLRDLGTPPDEIFLGLRIFAGGPHVLPPKLEGAVLTLLAYLFERCDIYEPARRAVS
jgi:hypothetical protein